MSSRNLSLRILVPGSLAGGESQRVGGCIVADLVKVATLLEVACVSRGLWPF